MILYFTDFKDEEIASKALLSVGKRKENTFFFLVTPSTPQRDCQKEQNNSLDTILILLSFHFISLQSRAKLSMVISSVLNFLPVLQAKNNFLFYSFSFRFHWFKMSTLVAGRCLSKFVPRDTFSRMSFHQIKIHHLKKYPMSSHGR